MFLSLVSQTFFAVNLDFLVTWLNPNASVWRENKVYGNYNIIQRYIPNTYTMIFGY